MERAIACRLRVGGTYWAAQPQLPPSYVLVRSHEALSRREKRATDVPVILWSDPALGLDWGASDPIRSTRDLQNPPIAAIPADRRPRR